MGFAVLTPPPATAVVPGDTRDLHAFGIRTAAAINQIRTGAISATMGVRLAQSDTTSVVQDSRISVWSYLDLMPLSAAAAAKLPGIWYELHQGSATIHHSATGPTDILDFILLIIG